MKEKIIKDDFKSIDLYKISKFFFTSWGIEDILRDISKDYSCRFSGEYEDYDFKELCFCTYEIMRKISIPIARLIPNYILRIYGTLNIFELTQKYKKLYCELYEDFEKLNLNYQFIRFMKERKTMIFERLDAILSFLKDNPQYPLIPKILIEHLKSKNTQ